DALMILTFFVRANDHHIPFTDKSSPDEIKQTIGISKAQFKRGLGHLMKQKLIKQDDGKTILIGTLEQSKEKN
ncbi:DNA-binding protein, partial [Enterococcus faecalis]